jgi:SIR2-like protein
MPTVLTNHDTTVLWRRLSRQEQFILKVHGDITRPDTVVLSARDYTEHIFGNLPFMQFPQRVIMSSSILFIGSSLFDIYLRRILEESRFLSGGIGMQHFALIGHTGPIRARLLRERYNVSVIPLSDYAEIGNAIEQLQREVAGN